jgi:hypothetical protein
MVVIFGKGGVTMRRIVLTSIISAAIALSGAATGCLYQKDSGSTSGVSALDAYGEAMGKVVAATGTAGDDWTAEMDKLSQVDFSTLSQDARMRYAREMLDVATRLHTAAAAATTAVRDVVPPGPCVNTHLLILESLQLTERGSLNAKQFYEAGIREGSTNGTTVLESANELLARADRAKVQAQATSAHDGCGLFQ